MAAAGGVDTNLYSRQLGVYGLATMGKLIKMNVLIVGMRSVGVETAKNLVLAGPRSVTIFDPTAVTGEDLGLNYYLDSTSIGKTRAECSVSQLAELNGYVLVNVLPEAELTEGVLDRFHVVVFCDSLVSTPDLVRFNEHCRSKEVPTGFIVADVNGVAGRAFVDFGAKHKVVDVDGEPARSAIVTGVLTEDGKTTVNTHDAKRHGFSDGDHVIFREVNGPEALNDGVPRKISNCSAYAFQLAEPLPADAAAYVSGGVVDQAKVPVVQTFGSLAERLATPVCEDDPMGALITPDFGKFGRPLQLHLAYAGLDAVRAATGALPRPHHADDAAAAVAGAKAFAAKHGVEEVDEAVVAAVARYASTQLPALGAFFGGVVAQEVVKFTGKFSPLRQWLYLDALEVATDPEGAAADEFTGGDGGRYTFSHVIFGRGFTERLRSQRVFLVGAGALGCEFFKNFALAGVGTAGAGGIVVTDMDNIEVSNLNRQFLFRPKDVGSAKSVCAGAAAAAMNPDLEGRVTAMEIPVGHDTEDKFNDEFWGGVDVVTNALDNVKARTYVDQRCVWFGKPLLESGTLGTKANTQVVLPGETESYGDSTDPPEESIPMCTLKNFPNQIEHCIEWSRDNFEGLFATAAQDAKAFALAPAKWLAEAEAEKNDFVRRAKLQGVVDSLATARAATWASCVAQARLRFERDYCSEIKQLLHNFPRDHTTAEGAPFWSGPKRCPTAAAYDGANATHRAYVAHAAALFASVYGVPVPADYAEPAALAASVAAVAVPAWEPRSVTIKADEKDEADEGGDDDGEVAAALLAELRAMAASDAEALAATGAKLNAQEFEKDDDSNHHIDFIAASANLRAANYEITPVDRHRVKLIAGKIIPAIATTTCAVTGLVMVEFYKVVRQMALPEAERSIEPLRNSFVSLAVNVYSMAEPMVPKRVRTKAFDPVMQTATRALPEGHTKWAKTVVPLSAGVDTPRKLIAWLKTHYAALSAADEAKAKAKAAEAGDSAAGAAGGGGGAAAGDDKPKKPPIVALAEDAIDVTMLLAGSVMLYASMYGARHAPRLDQNLKALYEELFLKGEGSVDEKYIVLAAAVETDDGDVELATPPVQIMLE